MPSSDRAAAADWARTMLADPRALILDTETTGLDDRAEIVQIAVIDMAGTVKLDTLVRPTMAIPPAATKIHGITDALVANAPTMATIYDSLLALLAGELVIIYNAAYDVRLLAQSIRAAAVTDPTLRGHDRSMAAFAQWHCAMLRYSAWIGDWNDYHGNYRWQRLPGGDHSALGDCRATLAVLQRMAEGV
ncbi:MAG TPA: 3'-5' exonuclease [Roseiflexaceae bacterium]|nr:3'-5' exonuclease [Roseiflexaceae bacterium]